MRRQLNDENIKLAKKKLEDYQNNNPHFDFAPYTEDSQDLLDLLLAFDEEPVWYGLDCQPGWLPLLINLHKSLNHFCPEYSIIQIKEKFGTLRFYSSSPLDVSGYIRWATRALISHAEAISAKTCEHCGLSDYLDAVKTRSPFNWYHTYCASCEILYIQKNLTDNDMTPQIEVLLKELEDAVAYKAKVAENIKSDSFKTLSFTKPIEIPSTD